ncbi:MAG: Rrf2 family transcriptional regulator [Rhizobiaceae bacterium]|nr:Rrf2 family transcriptional regulator [Rhizobiaceae bacterium]
MRLTVYTDYALRMLIYLAIGDDGQARVGDVADSYGISRNHLLKVALELGRLGYVTTTRGRSGGISLAKAPQDINLGEVVRHMEDDFGLVECLRAHGACCIAPSCRLKVLVREAIGAFLAVFDEYTLADLAADNTALRSLLDLGQGHGKLPSVA